MVDEMAALKVGLTAALKADKTAEQMEAMTAGYWAVGMV